MQLLHDSRNYAVRLSEFVRKTICRSHPHVQLDMTSAPAGAGPGAMAHNMFTKFAPRKDKRGVDLISDALPFGRLWYDGPNAASNAVG